MVSGKHLRNCSFSAAFFAALLFLLPGPVPAQGKHRAVVVGVAGFEHGYASLEYTARDARRVTSALEELGYSVSLLAADADAGKVEYTDVLRALRDAASRSRPGDTLLFFFAGHGSRRMNKDYLLLSDSDPDKFDTTALAFDTLSEIVAGSKATRRVFVIDACRNTSQRTEGKPGFADGKLDKDFKAGFDRLVAGQAPDSGVQTAALYACSPGETSRESVEERAGLFTQRFVQALQQSDAAMPITLGSVIGYVKAHMPPTVEQTPALSGPPALEISPAARRTVTLSAPAPSERPAPLPAVATKAEFTIDTSEAPEMQAFAAKLRPEVEKWYPILVSYLPSDGYVAPQRVTIKFRNIEGICYNNGSSVICAASWFKAHPEDLGAVIHELVHVVQQYRSPANPGWLVEGLADYLRWTRYEARPRLARPDPARAKYTDGYQTTAAFLEFVAANYDSKIIVHLNAALREGRYQPQLWNAFTGKSIDALWTEYVKSLSRT